jgi:hypothetical protein
MRGQTGSPGSSGRSGFLREGFRELRRKLERGKFRKQAQEQERGRSAALVGLGQRAWQEKAGLAAFAELRDQLAQIELRAGELAASKQKLETQQTELVARQKEETTRFDAQRQAVETKKRPVDNSLRDVRERESDLQRTLQRVTARQANLAVELARVEQELTALASGETPDQGGKFSAAQTKKQQVLAEQTRLAEELTQAQAALPALTAQSNRLAAESGAYEEELRRIAGERDTAIAPIVAEIQRLGGELSSLREQISLAEQQREEHFKQLGAGLFEAKSAEPVLAQSIEQISAIDRGRGATQGALEASLMLTRTMPRGTMLKFWSTVVFVPLLLIGCGYGIYAGWSWWEERQPQVVREVNPYLAHPLRDHPAYRLADKLMQASSESEVAQGMLEAFRSIGLGVYSHDGKKILGGAERSQSDFFLYDFEWKTLAHGFFGRTALNWDSHSRLLGRTLLGLKEPAPLAPMLARAVHDRYEAAVRLPNDPNNFLILLVDGLARHQLRPYTLAELPSRQPKNTYVDSLQSFLIMLDFFTVPPRRSNAVPASLLPLFQGGWLRSVYADEPCESINGEKEEGSWGKGLEWLQIASENAGEAGSAVGQGMGSEALQGVAETLGKIAKGVGAAIDVTKAIDAVSLLAGVTVEVRADPYTIHLPHSGEGKARFEATVTFDPKDLPDVTILCGRLHGEQMPGGRKPLKGVIVNWDWETEWNQYFRFTDETINEFMKTYGGAERNTKTDENGKTEISLRVVKPCKGKGRVVGNDYMMSVSTVQLIPAEASDLFAGLPSASYLLKFGPGLAQFFIENRTGSVRFSVQWHEKKPPEGGY